MSRAEAVPVPRTPSPLWTFGLLRSELVTTFRRWRTLALLGVLAAAAGTAATAYCVDYHVVPKRLTPGFEAHLGARSMTRVYAGIAIGLAAVALLRRVED